MNLEIVIIGAGAAGLVAAGVLCEAGYTPTVIDHKKEPAQKILITGKGRCNVTNNCDVDTFLQNIRSNPRFLYSAINSFNTNDTMQLFENLGVPLKTERGGRVFPVSDKAEDIRKALLKYASGMQFKHGQAAAVLNDGKRVTGVKLKNGEVISADAVLLCTGGLSYPTTGSTGNGYEIAEKLGHTIVKPTASLVGLTVKGKECPAMMGLALRNVGLKLVENNGKTVFSEQGEMLFTHFGMSGPMVLSASAHMQNGKQYNVFIDMKPALSFEELDKRILKDFEKHANKDIKNALDDLLPKKMIPIILNRWGIPEKKVHQVTKQERTGLVELIKKFTLPVHGKEDVAHAVITAGGISVKEVDPKTMQSKLVNGLYFAGEILDVDGYTGGFNLQIAFSTAVAAAKGIIKQTKGEE